MTKLATIKNGSWRNEEIAGTFELVKEWKDSPAGAFVTVKFEDGTVARVKCSRREVVVSTPDNDVGDESETGAVHVAGNAEESYRQNETPDEAVQRIRRSFEIVNEMTHGTVDGSVRGLIVSGPPGIGKSYGVEEVLTNHSLFARLRDRQERFTFVKGMATPIALYQILYNYRQAGKVIVFDDCDIVLHDDLSLNLLKAALDSSKKRRICWNSESRVLKEEDIPNEFEFEGSVIFLTNLNFDDVRSQKLKPHLDALKSRCLYMDLDIGNKNDMLLRIKQIMQDGLLKNYDMPVAAKNDVYNFVVTYVDDLRELSLRTVLKVADLYCANRETWQELAIHTVMKPEAKWRAMARWKASQTS